MPSSASFKSPRDCHWALTKELLGGGSSLCTVVAGHSCMLIINYHISIVLRRMLCICSIVSFQQQESSAVLPPTPYRQRPDRRSTYLPTIADYRMGLRVSFRSADQDQKITKLDNRFTKTTARLPPSPFSASSCSCCCTLMTKAGPTTCDILSI